jgi:hypothetical protein
MDLRLRCILLTGLSVLTARPCYAGISFGGSTDARQWPGLFLSWLGSLAWVGFQMLAAVMFEWLRSHWIPIGLASVAMAVFLWRQRSHWMPNWQLPPITLEPSQLRLTDSFKNSFRGLASILLGLTIVGGLAAGVWYLNNHRELLATLVIDSFAIVIIGIIFGGPAFLVSAWLRENGRADPKKPHSAVSYLLAVCLCFASLATLGHSIQRGRSSEDGHPLLDNRNCRANLVVLETALRSYAQNHQRRFPQKLDELQPKDLVVLPHCPLGGSYDYQVRTDASSCTVSCTSSHTLVKDVGPAESGTINGFSLP